MPERIQLRRTKGWRKPDGAVVVARPSKVLTLHQPWASLVALGVKKIETRSWSTSYRGRLAIHAGARRVQRGKWIGDWHTHLLTGDLWKPDEPEHPTVLLPLGAIVATCTLVDVVPTTANALPTRPEPLIDYFGLHDRDVTEVVERATGRRWNFDANRPYGDFTPGRFAWLLNDVEAVDPPVPFKGGQGLTRTWEPA